MDVVDAAAGLMLRRAARVLVLDETDQILLLLGIDPHVPDEPFWMAPGGGAEADEDAATCAARELYEETGLRLEPAALGAPVWRESVDFSFEGVPYRQEQEFFMVRAPRWVPRPAALDEVETRSLLGQRWWSIDELRATTDQVYPVGLVDLLRSLGVHG